MLSAMRVLVAPDKLKGSLTAPGAAAAIAQGVRAAGPSVEVTLCPVADGGEGTLDALLPALGGRLETTSVTGPLGSAVDARWGWVQQTRTAIIETAEAIGLHYVPAERRDPRRTTSHGVGELILAALDQGATRLLIGLGGSATTDAGAGMARALGARLSNVTEPVLGGDVARIDAIDASQIDPRLADVSVLVGCDVDNPLTGPEGAARAYAPQKGASSAVALELDDALARFAALLPGVTSTTPGAGAAGGLGFGLLAFCHAELLSGAKLVLDAVDFDAQLRAADLVITAEGRLDAQTARGKAVASVAARAAAHGVPCVALAGSVLLSARQVADLGLCAAFSICPGPISEAEATARARELLSARAEQLVRLWLKARA